MVLTNSDRGADLLLDVICSWRAWATDSPVKMVCPPTTITENRTALRAFAGMLGLGLIAHAGLVVAGIRAGRRRLGWIFSGVRILYIVLWLLILFLWWGGLYSTLFTPVIMAHYRPAAFDWITLAVTLWALAGIVTSFAPEVRSQK